MDTETLKYLEDFRKEVREEFKEITKELMDLSKDVSLLKKDVAGIKANEEKKDNRSFDWRKGIITGIVLLLSGALISQGINAILNASAENKRLQLELQQEKDKSKNQQTK